MPACNLSLSLSLPRHMYGADGEYTVYCCVALALTKTLTTVDQTWTRVGSSHGLGGDLST